MSAEAFVADKGLRLLSPCRLTLLVPGTDDDFMCGSFIVRNNGFLLKLS